MGRVTTGDTTKGKIRNGKSNEPKPLQEASVGAKRDGYVRPTKHGPKHSADCYRLLIFVLYGAGYGMVNHGGGLIEVLDFHRLYQGCGMDRRYVKKSLEKLEKFGYVSEVQWGQGTVRFIVRFPRLPLL